MQQFSDEQFALTKILGKLQKAHDAVTQQIDGYGAEYTDLKQYMMDYRNKI